jgi:hypothetical protein
MTDRSQVVTCRIAIAIVLRDGILNLTLGVIRNGCFTLLSFQAFLRKVEP